MTIRSIRTIACFAAAMILSTAAAAAVGSTFGEMAGPRRTVTAPDGESLEGPTLRIGSGTCPWWMCNGTQLTGIVLAGTRSSTPPISVALASGEVVRLQSGREPPHRSRR